VVQTWVFHLVPIFVHLSQFLIPWWSTRQVVDPRLSSFATVCNAAVLAVSTVGAVHLRMWSIVLSGA
jgi:hypothetical protein